MALPLLKETKPASSEMKSIPNAAQILEISFQTDVEARAIAERVGATALLNKMELNSKPIPTRKQLGSSKIQAVGSAV